jgi:hypothetical protein
MYVNGKIRPVETVPEVGGGRMKENDGGNEFNYDVLIYFKNFCKCINVSPPSTTVKKAKISPR